MDCRRREKTYSTSKSQVLGCMGKNAIIWSLVKFVKITDFAENAIIEWGGRTDECDLLKDTSGCVGTNASFV